MNDQGFNKTQLNELVQVVSTVVDKNLKPVIKRLNKIEKKLDAVIDHFDRRVIDVDKRLVKVEKHFGFETNPLI